MKYRVLTGSTPREIEEVVQLHVNEGWEPVGGVSVAAWVEAPPLPPEDESEYVDEIDEDAELPPTLDYNVYMQYTQAVIHQDDKAK